MTRLGRIITGLALISLPFGAPAAQAQGANDWSGLYGGLALGARNLDADWTTTQALRPSGAAISFASSPTASLDSTDFRAGLYAGYNWQFGIFVTGLEADVGLADNEDRVGRIPGLGPTLFGDPPTTSFVTVEAEWDASFRARVGALVLPNLLLYGTVGIAAQKIEVTTICPADTTVCNPDLGTVSFTSSKTQWGPTCGGGLEFALDAYWLVRAEYRYADFDSFGFVAIPAVSDQRFGANAEVEASTHTVSIGVTRKLYQ